MIDTKNFLGDGGFANVFLVTRKSDDAQVAMKKIKTPIVGMRDEYYNALKREIDAMKRLDNPFIIKLYEAFEQSDYIYLAIEYADEGSLEKHLEGK
jgi:serine/threonine protein kinase